MEDEGREDALLSSNKSDKEFERVLKRIPLNSYERSVIFNILTPGK
jgi:hypothetical protein